MVQTIETLSVRVDHLEQQTTELFERTNNAAISLATVNEKLNSMLVTLGELKAGLNTLQQMPGKRWESIVGSAITAIVASLVGFIAATLFR